MNNRGEGRVWKLAGILLSCWEWPLSWARSRYCQQEVSSCQMTRHSGSAWTTLLPAPILRLGIRSVQLPSIKAIIGTRACTVTLRRSIYRGKVRGRTSMMLRFDRLVMPDGRRLPIHAEIVELYHAPSGEKVDVEGAIESSSRGRKSIEHTVIGAGAGALLGGIFGGGKGAGIGSIVGGAGGLGTTAFHGHQKITLSSGQEMMIRVTR